MVLYVHLTVYCGLKLILMVVIILCSVQVFRSKFSIIPVLVYSIIKRSRTQCGNYDFKRLRFKRSDQVCGRACKITLNSVRTRRLVFFFFKGGGRPLCALGDNYIVITTGIICLCGTLTPSLSLCQQYVNPKREICHTWRAGFSKT